MAKDSKVGEYAFLLGILIAALVGIVEGASLAVLPVGVIALVLLVLGLIVGFLNIKDSEITGFLVAAIALTLASSANFSAIDSLVAPLGAIVNAILANFAVFVAPAAVIVALKAIMNAARD